MAEKCKPEDYSNTIRWLPVRAKWLFPGPTLIGCPRRPSSPRVNHRSMDISVRQPPQGDRRCLCCGWTLHTHSVPIWLIRQEPRNQRSVVSWMPLCLCGDRAWCLACLGRGTLTHPTVSRSLHSFLCLGVLGAGRQGRKERPQLSFRCVIEFCTCYSSFLMNVFQVSWILMIIYLKTDRTRNSLLFSCSVFLELLSKHLTSLWNDFHERTKHTLPLVFGCVCLLV